MKCQNEAKLLQLSTTIQNNLQKLMSSTFQRTLQENVVIKTEVSFLCTKAICLQLIRYRYYTYTYNLPIRRYTERI